MATIIRIGKYDSALRWYWTQTETWVLTADAEELMGELPFDYVYVHQCGLSPTAPGPNASFAGPYRYSATCHVPSLSVDTREHAEDVSKIIYRKVLDTDLIPPDVIFFVELWLSEVAPAALAGKEFLDPRDLGPRHLPVRGGGTLAQIWAAGPSIFLAPYWNMIRRQC